MARKLRRGKRMTRGYGWRLETTKGKKKGFAATLLKTINLGRRRIAIFSVPKRFA